MFEAIRLFFSRLNLLLKILIFGDEKRFFPLGFPTTRLRPGDVATLASTPQVPFLGRQLIIPSALAKDLILLDLRVGRQSIFTSWHPAPATGFTEIGFPVELEMPRSKPGEIVTLHLENTSDHEVIVNAVLMGSVKRRHLK